VIRINLLGVDRLRVRKAPAFDMARRLTLVCTLLLVATAAGVGWWYWSIRQESTRLDADIATAQRESARLRTVLTEVQQFEVRRTQLQQRVALIEQLRGGQSLPVQLLDHVSRSLPDMLWLTDFEQKGGAVTIQGRSTTLIALSDFVGSLGNSTLLQKPIEIIDSQVEERRGAKDEPTGEVIRFTVKAQLTPVAKPKEPASAARGRGVAAGPTGGKGAGS
jgi:type IV pilus assembly protein PilN